MTLRDEAMRLTRALDEILECLKSYDKDERSKYTRAKAVELAPCVSAFKEAVNNIRSRESAQRALDDMSELMGEISGAATKGAIDLDSGEALNEYWELRTIFRETRYRDENLS